MPLPAFCNILLGFFLLVGLSLKSQVNSLSQLCRTTWQTNEPYMAVHSLFQKDSLLLIAVRKTDLSLTSNGFLKFNKNNHLVYSDTPKKTSDNSNSHDECDAAAGCIYWRINATKQEITLWLYTYDAEQKKGSRNWQNVETVVFTARQMGSDTLLLLAQKGKLVVTISPRQGADTNHLNQSLRLWLKKKDGALASPTKNTSLQFTFDRLPSYTSTLSVSCADVYPDSTLVDVVINNYQTRFITFAYPPVCEYTSNYLDSICPICHKSDQVLPIQQKHAEVPIKSRKKTRIYVPYFPYKLCQPHWYCKRDDKDF